MGEKGRHEGPGAVERGRTDEVKAERNRLMWEACFLPRARVMSRPGLLPRALSGSMVLLQPGSVLMPMTHAATKGHKDAQGLGCHLWPCGCLRTVSLLGSCPHREHADMSGLCCHWGP